MSQDNLSPFTKKHFIDIWTQLEPEWKRIMRKSNKYLTDAITKTLEYGKCAPVPEMIFRAFNTCPPYLIHNNELYRNLRVVLIGQDPYPNNIDATGLAFGVPPNVTIPPSLKNIFACLNHSLGISMPTNGDLTHWAEQGVLLLNTALTYCGKNAQPTMLKIWAQFTNELIKNISDEFDGIIFILLGENAQKMKKFISADKHHILTWGHPSPASTINNDVKDPRHFIHCDVFQKTNKILTPHFTIEWGQLEYLQALEREREQAQAREREQMREQMREQPHEQNNMITAPIANSQLDAVKDVKPIDNTITKHESDIIITMPEDQKTDITYIDPNKFTLNYEVKEVIPKMQANAAILFTDGGATKNGRIGCRASWAYATILLHTDPKKDISRNMTKITSINKFNYGDMTFEKPEETEYQYNNGEVALGRIQNAVIVPSNNRGELTAIIEGLGFLIENGIDRALVISDSEITINTMTEWIHTWLKKNTVNDKKNPDLVMNLYEKTKKFKNLLWMHTRSHTDKPIKTKGVENAFDIFKWHFNDVVDKCCTEILN